MFVEYSLNDIRRDLRIMRFVDFLMSFEGARDVIAFVPMVEGDYEAGLN
jgi:hypothetical protein